MHSPITWQQWTQQLCTYIEAQARRIDKLEQTVDKLQADLTTLKDQRRVHIDKIEYKFDQLKVEKLDGTLTIGINPSALDHIDDFMVNGNSMGKKTSMNNQDFPLTQEQNSEKAEPNSTIQQEVSNGIEQYLQQEVQHDMRSLELKYQYALDDDYKELILEDIRKQLDVRIQHYVNQYRGVGFNEPIKSTVSSITKKTKQDIFSAIETYISSLPRKEGPQ